MEPSGEWTALDLLNAARKHGHTKVSQRLIVDWTERGLLDSPRRRPTGRGSDPAVWSDSQQQLFLTLLDKRRNGAKRIATLCNIPVWLWIGWGDDYVPVRQVRKALRTYSDSYKTASGRASEFTARQFFEMLGVAKPTALQRDLLTTALTGLAASPRVELGALEPDLADALRKAIAPNGTRLDLPTVTNTVWMINCRLAAAATFRDGTDETELPDQVFKNAQFLYRQTAPGYFNAPGAVAKARIEEVANNACVNLLFDLGRNLTTALPPSSSAGMKAPG